MKKGNKVKAPEYVPTTVGPTVAATMNPARDVANVIQKQIEELNQNLRDKLLKASKSLKIKNARDFKAIAEVEFMNREGLGGLTNIKSNRPITLVYMDSPSQVTINPEKQPETKGKP